MRKEQDGWRREAGFGVTGAPKVRVEASVTLSWNTISRFGREGWTGYDGGRSPSSRFRVEGEEERRREGEKERRREGEKERRREGEKERRREGGKA
ncbi:hypothetical protein LY76DRAFT_238432 [Colletotrichum caudatum]|nr:hypothetical protein LY76DRAFT_238432 [Colletotrichum caudatum]